MEFSEKALLNSSEFLVYTDNIYKNCNFIIFWRQYNTFCIVIYELAHRSVLKLWTSRKVTGRKRRLFNEKFYTGSRQIW